ncbi:MAG TPA: L,D-transpeptidase family protein [Clostridium sp.]|uniref:L,D-transpeptidase family protein n=1 Tax=Clostridium sp. TaxID=1506 RepID=UPI002F94C900
MKKSKKVNVILLIFVLVALISITAYNKLPSIFAKNEAQTTTTLAINKQPTQLEKIQLLAKRQKLEDQKKLENQKKLVDLKNLEKRKKKAEVIKQKQNSSQNKTTSIKPIVIATPVVNPKLLIDKIQGKGNSRQAIVVTTNALGNVSATITTFEKVNGAWKQLNSFAGNVGRNGFAYNKIEGDGHSPIGIFTLGTTFGRYSNPGTEMNYRQSTANDFWVDDVNSPLYNSWQKGPISGRWSSAENMYIPQYNYGFVINYNTADRIPGKGSAIFFHVWSGAGHGTAGCIATDQDNVIRILKWLTPSKNPIIIQGSMSSVLRM